MATERWLEQMMAEVKESSSTSDKKKEREKGGSASPSTVLPKSVRNAPPELRQAIRRSQNAEVRLNISNWRIN